MPHELDDEPAGGTDGAVREREPAPPSTGAPAAGVPPTGAPRAPRAPRVTARSAVGPAAPALSVAGAARGLGVAPATLRSWERRYGLAPSHHTPGGHRRYGADDLIRLQVMNRLVRLGVPAAEAARVARATSTATLPDPTGPFAALLASPQAVAPQIPAGPAPGDPPGEAQRLDPVQGSPGGGRVLPLPRASQEARGLARSVMSLDAVACSEVLARSLADRGAVATWEDLVRPVMGAIGDRWQRTTRGVEIEHSFSVVVSSQLARHSMGLPRAANDRPVLMASVPEEMHDLPLCALQAALAEAGIRGHLLGARTPGDALADAVSRLGPPVVVLWAQLGVSAVPAIPAMRPSPEVILGGPGFHSVATRLPMAVSLADAVGRVRRAMGL